MTDWIVKIFGTAKPIIGVIHLPPLPGSPLYKSNNKISQIVNYALIEADKYFSAGFDAVIVENYGDKPYEPRCSRVETIASMTVIVRSIVEEYGRPVGVSLLRNSGPEAMAIASAAEASFIRVNALGEVMVSPEGILQPVARKIVEIREIFGSHVKIMADVFCKHATPLHGMDMIDVARDLIERCMADAIILTGKRTGEPPDIEQLLRTKKIINVPLIVGSGISIENILDYWEHADGFIVGTSLKTGSKTENPVDEHKACEFAEKVVKLKMRGEYFD